MSERPAERIWQCKLGEEWLRVVGMGPEALVLANGMGVAWAGPGFLPLPEMFGRLRYTVTFHGLYMPWRTAGRSGLALLAQDFDRLDLEAAIRHAQAADRQRRTA